MSQKRIRALIETRLRTWAAGRSPALPVAWQNKPLNQVPTTTYLRAFLLPAETGSQDLAGAHRRYTGVYQISIVLPAGDGSETGEGIVGEIEALFPLNLRLTIASPEFAVSTITPASAATAIQSDGRYTIPVSFRYRSDIFE